MYTFDKYIGQQVRRVVFAIKIDGKYYHLMSIWEHLEPDMSDRCAFPSNGGKAFMDRVEKADSNKKVYVFVEEVTLNHEMYSAPWDNIKDDEGQIFSTSSKYTYNTLYHAGADVIPLSENNPHRIVSVLPRRDSTAYVSYYLPQEPDDQIQGWLEDKKIQEQLKTLSERNFGYNLCKYTEFVGQYIFVSYNPIYRSIEWREDENGLGVHYCIHYRNGQKRPLRIEVEGYNEGNFKIFDESREINEFEGFISFRSQGIMSFKYLRAYIFDKDGILIDYDPYMYFVHQINVDIAVHEHTVRVKDNNGRVVREVEKYRSDTPLQIGSIPRSLLEDNGLTYQQMEETLDFVYLDGDRNGTHINREKGIQLIQRIINSAKRICYICDVYFNSSDFEEFIWGASSLSVEMRILTSRLGLPDENARMAMFARLKEYNEKVRGNVNCRLLVGKDPILHDRLVIADDQVWMLGSSLNHFGAKATTLIRVPKMYRKHLIEKIESLWNSDRESNVLEV